MYRQILLVTSKAQADTCRSQFEKNAENILVVNTGGQITKIDTMRPITIKEENEVEEHWLLNKDKDKLIEYLKRFYEEGSEFILAGNGSIESEKIASDLHHLALKDKIKITILSSLKYSDIKKSMEEARGVDFDRARAASVRKIIDILIGVRLSGVMRWHLGQSGYSIPATLSIGRIMCPALKVLCENQKEIDTHKSEGFVRLKCWYRQSGERFEILDKTRFFTDSYEHTVQLKELSNKLSGNPHVVTNYIEKQREESPPEPLSLSGLDIAAFNCFRTLSEDTAKIANELYIAGYISNSKTKSNQISDDTFDAMVAYLYQTLDEDSVVDIPRRFRCPEGVSDNEHAITPTVFDEVHAPEKIEQLWERRGETHLTKKHFEIYQLVWFRTLATQVENAFFDSTELSVQVADHKMKMIANRFLEEIDEDGNEVKRMGWLVLNESLLRNSITISEDGWRNNDTLIPYFDVGEVAECVDITEFNSGTQPPKRYGEARFIKTLERMRISQPGSLSTLAQKMIAHGLIEHKNIILSVRALGKRVNEWIEKHAEFLQDTDEVVAVSETLKLIEEGEHPDPDNLIRKTLYKIQEVEKSLGFNRDNIEEKPSVLQVQEARRIAGEKGIKLGAGVFKNKESVELFLRNNGVESEEEQEIEAPDDIIGACPQCKKGSVLRRSNFYGCSEYQKDNCKFGINIEYTLKFFERFGIEDMSLEYLDKLIGFMLTKEYAEVNNMVSALNETFTGRLTILKKGDYWNITFFKKRSEN